MTGWRRRRLRVAVLIIGSAAAVGTLVWPAAAGDPAGATKLSWFYKPQQPNSPSIAATSGVPAGNYAVAFTGAYAIARTVLEVPVGTATSATLVLPVDSAASSSPAAAQVIACPADSGWPVEEGGPWAHQPLYSCPPQVAGRYDAKSSTVSVRLDALIPNARDGLLQVMLTPAEDPQPNTNVVPTPGSPDATPWTLSIPGKQVRLQPAAATNRPDTGGGSPGTGTSTHAPGAVPGGDGSSTSGIPPLGIGTGTTRAEGPAAPAPADAGSAPVVAPAPADTSPVAAKVASGRFWNPSRWPLALLVFAAVAGMAITRQAGGTGLGAARQAIKSADPETPAVEVRGLRVRFGGVEAVRDVSFSVQQGQIVGLIGPNGAGKTTVLDAITGLVESGGEVLLLGGNVTSLDTARRAELGLGRSFQDGRLFPSLTVRESLAVALEQSSRKVGTIAGAIGAGTSAANERTVQQRVDELLDLMGLRPFEDKFVSELSTGSRRIVDLAAMVAHGARVLLLDEPSSGIAQKETEALGPLLTRLRERLDCTILLIEHDMPLISAVADRLIAFEVGSIISDGSPQEVLHDPVVVDAYLGTDASAVQRSGRVPALAAT